MTKNKKLEVSSTLKTALLVVIILMIGVGAFSVPIANSNDIYVEYSVLQPLLDSPQITNLNVYAHPSTLLQAPAWGGAILTGESVVVLAKTATKSARVTIGPIYRTQSSVGTVVIRNVPATEKTITVELYEAEKLVSSKEVTLI